jgi:putative effector of murein hydrolase
LDYHKNVFVIFGINLTLAAWVAAKPMASRQTTPFAIPFKLVSLVALVVNRLTNGIILAGDETMFKLGGSRTGNNS